MTFLMVVLVIHGTAEEEIILLGDYEEGQGMILFSVTFATSALSAGLGLAKCLKVGACRVLAEGGCLGGLLAPRFLLLFAACLLSLVGKGLALAAPFGYWRFKDEHKVPVIAT